jgi:heterodisulfide reductase subunit C
MNNDTLQQKVLKHPVGKKILQCIQCGTCSGSCPLNHLMDHTPREIFALIRDGDMNAVLTSNTPWFCVSCYHCMPRCPREIPVTDIMYLLKQMSVAQDLEPKSHKMPHMYKIFRHDIGLHGRVTAANLMRRYGLQHPGDILAKTPLGLELLKRKRLEILPQRISAPRQLARMLAGKGKKQA